MYDVIVVGGGPGGYKCAELLGKQRLKVALIEENVIGGVCLNQGCIPFKSYLNVSRVYSKVSKLTSQKIISKSDFILNQEAILNNKRSIIKELRQSVEYLVKSYNVDIIQGHAKVLEDKGNFISIDVNGDRLECLRLVLATGSVEKILSDEFSSAMLMSSKEMLELKVFPKTIDIIGGGAIGLEIASYYADIGSKVTIIEALDHIGGQIDMEISAVLRRILEKKGISILTDAKVVEMDMDSATYFHRGEKICSKPECIFCSIGRMPQYDMKTLSILNVELDKSGVKIDEFCRTSNSKVYACGDVTGKWMFAHTAYRQAKVIADSICGKESRVDYSVIPRIIYTNPEVLSVGYNEEECNELGIVYFAKSLPMTYSGRYFAENGKDGAVAKMIVDDNRRLIGFHMIGNGAAELSIAAEMMILNRMSADEICELVFAHPTYSEIVGELAARL